MKLIVHKNFNPRVIEGFIKKQIWRDVPSKLFMTTFLDFFDRPLSVWEKAFTNLEISARYALLVFATLGNDVYYDEWQAAYKYFCVKSHEELRLVYEDTSWLTTVKILQDCFVKIEIRSGKKKVTPFNPSIMDFCASYIRENKTTLTILLKSALYTEQLTTLFTDSMNYNEAPGWQVEVSPKLFTLFDEIRQEVRNNIDSMDYPQIKRRNDTTFLLDLLKKFPIYCRTIDRFIENNFNYEELHSDIIPSSKRFDLMRRIDWKIVPINPLNTLYEIAGNEILYPTEWNDYLDTVIDLGLSEFLDSSVIHEMESQLMGEIENIQYPHECEELLDIINQIDKKLTEWDNNDLLDILSETEEKLRNDEEDDDYPDDYDYYERKLENEDSSIHEMFTSLYEE